MKESNASDPLPLAPTALVHDRTPTEPRTPAGSISCWSKRLLACNPFYLLSAALLLYGVYRVSVDPAFRPRETAQLIFNFVSLQCYEVLLVLTAILLARRRIWYDSTLLVVLENLLVLAPFILVSQAALIDQSTVWAMCLGGGFIASVRFGSLKRFIAELNLPARLIGSGLLLLLVNVALPVVYRLLHEAKVGTKPSWGAAYETNQCAWLWLVPALCAMANFLRPGRPSGGRLLQRGWAPLGLFSLWLMGTGVHLYCLGYVYDFALRRELVAPGIWMICWTASRLMGGAVPSRARSWPRALLVLPVLTPLIAASEVGHAVFVALTALNAVIYGGVYYRHRGQRLALELLFVALAMLIGGWPQGWSPARPAEFSRLSCVGAAAAAYLLIRTALSRNPKAGVLGTVISATVVICAGGNDPNLHLAFQVGFAFLLLHSLRWVDAEHEGAALVRGVTGLAWAAHAGFWMHFGGQPWMACAVAAPVLTAYLAAGLFSGRWASWVIPLATILVMVSGPGNSAADRLHTAPVGVLAVIASFVLFGVGTLAALTRHRWSRTGPGVPANDPQGGGGS